MPNLRTNFSYEISNTYITDAGEGRLEVKINFEESPNTFLSVAEFKFGTGLEDPNTANVEQLLYIAAPNYFID